VRDKKYLSQPGLWAHKKNCIAPEPIFPAVVMVVHEMDLHAKIDGLHTEIDSLKGMIIEMEKTQHPPTTINNDNTNNISNYITVFLNDKCRNA
jgi:hypothetical protein